MLHNEMYSDQDRDCYGLGYIEAHINCKCLPLLFPCVEELKLKVDIKSNETYKAIKFEKTLDIYDSI